MSIREVMERYKKLGPKEWGIICAKGLLSEVPFVGGLLSEAISPIGGNMTAVAHYPVIAAYTFDPFSREFSGIGLASVTDGGVGDYRFTFIKPCNDQYIVHAQVNDANVDILNQDANGFNMKVVGRASGETIDKPVKFLILKSSSTNNSAAQ